MSLWKDFLDWLASLTKVGHHVRRRSKYNAPKVTIEIHESNQLRQKKNKTPSIVVSKALAQALDSVGVNYEIKYNYTSTDAPPIESPYDKDWATIEWWGKQYESSDADCLLLLTDSYGGVTGGRHSVAGASGLHGWSSPVKVGTGQTAKALHAALHEVGHALGVPGDNKTDKKGTQTLGESWIESGRWHRTLMMSTDKAHVNECGKTIDPNTNDLPVVYHQRYCPCAAQRIRDRAG